jgi:hypothetical protein
MHGPQPWRQNATKRYGFRLVEWADIPMPDVVMIAGATMSKPIDRGS